jgi:HTH-type transcriptional regulator, sugar sensing transcriptional regulator
MDSNHFELRRCLTDLGMSEREARVYLALLSRRTGTATDLQKISGVPQSKIYEIIGSLVRRGFCTERKSGRKRTFEVIDPSVALDTSFQNLQKRLENSVKLKKELFNLYKSTKKGSEPLEYVEVLRGNDNIHHRYCQLVQGVKKELLGFGRRPYACDTAEKSSEQDRESEDILSRGVSSRWVFELDIPEDEWVFLDLKKLYHQGEEIRVAEKLPLKMMIFDRELLLVAEESPFEKSGELAMSVIKQGTIVNAFYALFEFFFEHSVDLLTWEKMVFIDRALVE